MNAATMEIIKKLPPDQIIPFLEGTWKPLEESFPAESSLQVEVNKEFTKICEAKSGSGTIRIKLISPGQGSSGYYPTEVLKRDGPNVFKSGLRMFWDHATEAEAKARPEGSLSRLAGILKSNAVWEDNVLHGPGLYADAKPLNGYDKAISELSEHDAFGVSIRGGGMARKAQVAGHVTNIFEQLTTAESVDFVTLPGRGGKVVQIFESARPAVEDEKGKKKEKKVAEIDDVELTSLRESKKRLDSLEPSVTGMQSQLLRYAAKDIVSESLVASELKKTAYSKVMKECLAAVPVKDGAINTEAFAATVKESIDEYIALVGKEPTVAVAAPVRGLGASFKGIGTEVVNVAESAVELDKSILNLCGLPAKKAS